MRKPEIHEILAQLYLRLSGYFTTGLILHSDTWGQACTEIDCLAVRHRHHSQSEREVNSPDFLDLRDDDIDIILCEVKSDPSQLNFNKPLKENLETLQAALRCSGVFSERQIDPVATQLQTLLQDNVSKKTAQAGIVDGTVRIRPLLCCPPATEIPGDKWCLLGTEIFRFANECFNPRERRESCSTRYNFQLWGHPFTPVVQYIKDPHIETCQKSLEGLYECLGA